jgi:hypothetical protein
VITCLVSRWHPSASAHAIAPENTGQSSRKLPLIQRPFYPTGNGGKNWSAVTTTHLFWPNQRRKAVFLLPIWLRYSGLFGRRHEQFAEGRGGIGTAQPAKGLDPKAHSEFYA